jgi:phosphate:Na+ symporter
MDYVGIAISFLGSLGLFLFGMNVLSSGLQKSAGEKMKSILGKMSKNRLRGVLFGTGVTAIIQSSTATTVMAVGFVNAGIIALSQTVGIIMGANLGSTTTSWLVSSVEWASFLRPDVLGAVAAVSGALMLLFAKKENLKNIAEVIAGFGVLFIGLSQMPQAVRPLAELDIIRQLFISLGNNPLLALLAGVAVTGVIQSSTASIGILQSMAITGMIPWSAAVFIVLGQNLGTCFTTMLTSIGKNKNTRAAAYIHFVYKAIGAILFSTIGFIFFTFINPEFGHEAVSSTNISIIHTGYNVALLLILFPLGNLILKIAIKMAGKDKDETANEYGLEELDETILDTPAYAIENSVKSIQKLMDLVRENLAIASTGFVEKKYDRPELFWRQAAKADKVNEAISNFLTKLYSEKLTKEENAEVAAYFHVLISLKRIGNHAKGLAKLTADVQKGHLEYSAIAIEELKHISSEVIQSSGRMVKAFTSRCTDEINEVVHDAEIIANMQQEYKSKHFDRTISGDYSVQSGLTYAEAARHFYRIAVSMESVVQAVLNREDVYW